MDGLTDEQVELVRTVRTVLDREGGTTGDPDTTGYDRKLWSVLCGQVGVAGLAIPERFGGLGTGLVELQLVAEEIGKRLAQVPLLGSTTLATQALLTSDNDDACLRLLPGLADGSSLATLAWVTATGHWSPEVAAFTAQGAGDTATLEGTAHYVLDGDVADVLLAVAHVDDGLALFAMDAGQEGVVAEHTPAMDPTRRLATVTLHGARAERVSGTDYRAGLAAARDAACTVLSAEQVGAAEQALASTVEYTKNRVQFGRAIGSFQALKHRMADMHVLVEAARSASYYAGETIDERSEHAGQAALAAKVYCSDAFSQVASEMIQLHGGIAITWEHEAHLYFKRAHSTAQLFGQPHEHLERHSPDRSARH